MLALVVLALVLALSGGDSDDRDDPPASAATPAPTAPPAPAAATPHGGTSPVGFSAEQTALTKRIVATDPAVKDFFAARPYRITQIGPWHTSETLKVVGGSLEIRFEKPVTGIFELPGITSHEKQTSRPFHLPWRGVTTAVVMVRFEGRKVVGVSPIDNRPTPEDVEEARRHAGG